MKIKSLLTALLLLSPLASQAQLSILFDYSFDANGFFTDVTRRTRLEEAAIALSSRLNDTFDAITPGGANDWTADFKNPADGSDESVSNPSVAANTLLIYAGGRLDLGGAGVLGLGGPGGFDAVGTEAFLTAVQSRGEFAFNTPPEDQTDFGPWGGSIAFDSDAPWHFGSDPSVPGGQFDFYTVALHELAHVLGFGIANSWNNLVTGNDFHGTTSMSLNSGNPVPLNGGDHAHWESGKTSTLPGTSTVQETLMDPDLLAGTRKFGTDLDFAGLDDIGFDIVAVPEPMEYALVAGLGLLGFAVYRRRTARPV